MNGGNKRARIFQPAKTAMQSGRAKTKRWVLEYEPVSPRGHDPLMGWISSKDPTRQIRLTFPTKEEAVAYAEKHGLDYELFEPHRRPIRPKSYAANFQWNKVE